MSGITFISRDYGVNVSIVRLTSTDNTATCLANGYITAQAANIALANNAVGSSTPFQWYANDTILLSASDGNTFCSINASFATLTAYIASQQLAEVNLSAAQVNAMYDTPVLAVPAAAAGTVNIVKQAYLSVEFNSAQYTAGGAIALQYKNTVHGAGTAATATIAAATLNGVAANEVLLFSPVSTLLLANATAQAIYISNASADFATGDSPVKLYVYYNNITV